MSWIRRRANKSAEAIKNVGAELYAQIARFAANMATIGFKLRGQRKGL